MSGFGSKTGSCLEPSGAPFRDEFAFASSGRAGVATATVEESVSADSRFEGQPTGVAVEVSSTSDSQPNGRNISSIHKWGIASLFRHFRKDADVKPAEKMQYPEVMACTMTTEDRLGEAMPTMPAEDRLDYAPGADQRNLLPECEASAGSTGLQNQWESQSLSSLCPTSQWWLSDKPWWPASYVMQWPEEEPQPAVTTQSHVRAWDERCDHGCQAALAKIQLRVVLVGNGCASLDGGTPGLDPGGEGSLAANPHCSPNLSLDTRRVGISAPPQ